MNVISGLMAIAETPVIVRENDDPCHLRLQLHRRGLRRLRHADQRSLGHGMFLFCKKLTTSISIVYGQAMKQAITDLFRSPGVAFEGEPGHKKPTH